LQIPQTGGTGDAGASISSCPGVVFLAPRELYRLDLKPGDKLPVETRRGAVEVKVRADSDVPVGMVFMPFCYAEAAANLLTNPALDPTGKIPEFKFCAARV